MSDARRKLGDAAERRVIRKIGTRVTTIEDESKVYPDFSFEAHVEYFSDVPEFFYGVEVKTMKGFYECERVGTLSVSRAEFQAYEKLSLEMNVILIVEIRPRGWHWSNYLYYVVDWNLLRKEFLESNPSVRTLSMWWVLKNGVNLETWLKHVC